MPRPRRQCFAEARMADAPRLSAAALWQGRLGRVLSALSHTSFPAYTERNRLQAAPERLAWSDRRRTTSRSPVVLTRLRPPVLTPPRQAISSWVSNSSLHGQRLPAVNRSELPLEVSTPQGVYSGGETPRVCATKLIGATALMKTDTLLKTPRPS